MGLFGPIKTERYEIDGGEKYEEMVDGRSTYPIMELSTRVAAGLAVQGRSTAQSPKIN